MSRLTYYFFLSRPRFWLYTLGPCMVGLAAAAYGFTPGVKVLLSPFALFGYLYFGIFFNLLVYGINDYFDVDIDKHSTKKTGRELTHQTVHLKEILLVTLPASILYLVYLPDLYTQFTLIVALILGVFYSAPPFRLKTKVFLDSISNGFYILPGVIGFAGIKSDSPSLAVIAAAWLWTMGMHLFSAIPDIESDTKAGIMTTAVLLGDKKSLLLSSFYWMLSTLIATYIFWPFFIIGLVYVLMLIVVYLNRLTEYRAYWLFPYINAIIGFIIFMIAFIA